MAGKKAHKSPRVKRTDSKSVIVAEARELPEWADEKIQLTPQQARFLQFYYDPASPTWGRARGSAIAAGFDEDYASQITYRKPKWWLEFVRGQDLAGLIEKHFTEVMTLPSITQAMGAFGPLVKKEKVKEQVGFHKNGEPKFKSKTIETPIMVMNVPLIKAKTEVAKIAAPAHDPERYGKVKGGDTFIFNVKAARERYSGSQNARIS